MPNPAAAVLGRHRLKSTRFVGVVEQNFRTGDANKIVHALTIHELADLATLYRGAGGSTTLLRLMAAKVDAQGLAQVASAFGQAETAAAIDVYAPASVRSQFKELPIQNAAEPSLSVRSILQGQRLDGMVTDIARGPTLDAPNLNMTPYEIYLDFRTAPFGSSTVASSLYEAGNFMSGPLGKAAITGAMQLERRSMIL